VKSRLDAVGVVPVTPAPDGDIDGRLTEAGDGRGGGRSDFSGEGIADPLGEVVVTVVIVEAVGARAAFDRRRSGGG
jgi:hypothetical protein